ncbi:MAG: hypothetical protein A2879_03625 [Omnitrophica WOR_2 bacterium RIFCSPHIGHO2_01_FULL_49_10]|nr:MAG: hypothetical protein A2879_03625 [Omnitrophica WOR_2 bacterium RIFCSPHIGHO2_01_FULL_49_10]
MLAAACTTFAFFPQVYKIYKTKSTRDLSLPMYAIFSTGSFLWLIYGISVKSLPVISANSVTLILSCYILVMIIKHK